MWIGFVDVDMIDIRFYGLIEQRALKKQPKYSKKNKNF